MTPTQVVEQIYSAFSRGDLNTVIAQMADDVRWEEWSENSAQAAGVPWMQPRRGKAGVTEFLQLLGQFQMHDFEVLSIMGNDRQVAAEFVIEATPPGGRRYRDEEIHLWTFDSNGKVVRLRHYADTAKHIAAAKSDDR